MSTVAKDDLTERDAAPALWLPRIRQALTAADGRPLQALLGDEPPREEGSGPSPLADVASLLGWPLWRLQDLAGRSACFEALPFADCARRRCGLVRAPMTMPPGAIGGTNTAVNSQCLLITDPFDQDQVAWARTRFGALDVVLVSEETFDAWMAQSEAGLSALQGALPAGADSANAGVGRSAVSAEDIDLRQIGHGEGAAVRFVNATLYDALKLGASDVHLECLPTGLAVKFRLDGVLTAIGQVDDAVLAAQAISRIKVMAQLDIAERRVPQDGRLQVSYTGRAIDLRVSIMPSIHGEDAVLRILDRQHLAQSLAGLTLAKLGFDAGAVQGLHRQCRKPHGMVLVTGPTGSGKTTTLYAAIADTHQSRDKIITIEDPVEYQLPGVLQIPVNERKGLGFARGLRSILRHDPDKILVGEIRDAETAQIAVQAALTGHLVFTTVHANNAFDVAGRFLQFGIDGYTLASALNGVLAQRLLRRLCAHCTRSTAMPVLDPADLAWLAQAQPMQAWRETVGCEFCRGSGYSGRFALGELLELTPALRSLIAGRALQAEIEQEARRAGWQPLRQLALVAACQGLTTLDEVNRVGA